ncbi:unnamed protein product [Lactuca virosa]|uniref:Uncharacterized protein n=1 Tax=Lactuca virosa TaxID=75947 RepID=A0AAU9NC68_9ASTR|nr:unnamed protein product [Lactuca virosa]
MFYGATTDRAAGPSPELSLEEHGIVSCLSGIFVKWVNPEEIMLGMVGISAYWNKLGKKPMETLVGSEVTLLDDYTGSAWLVLRWSQRKQPSLIPPLNRSLLWTVLLIPLSRGLSSSSHQALFEPVNPDPSLEPPATTTLHEFPVTTDPELNHAEEKLASPAETSNFGIPLHSTSGETPIIESIELSSKIQTPATLFAASAFQQKLFGAGFGVLHVLNTDSTSVTMEPLLLD